MTDPLRVAIVGTRGIPARYGGYETFAEWLSTSLARAGHEVVVTCEPGSEGPELLHGVRRAIVPAPGRGPLRTLLHDLLALLRVARRSDVVYMLGYASSPFCWIPRLCGAEVWINMDGIEWRRAKWGPLARLWLRATERVALLVASRVVLDADAVRADLEARHGPLAKGRVIPYPAEPVPAGPIDDEALAHLGLRPFEFDLVVCRLEPENHVLEILRAHEHAATGRSLAVVADHRSGTPYARACREAAGGSARFLGAIYDRPRLDQLRRACAAYLHGHSVGGTNPSLLEALAAGAVCVAHDNPFNREVLGPDGRYFADGAALARELRALSDVAPERRAELSAAARRRADERYAPARILALYEDALASVRRRTSRQPGATRWKPVASRDARSS